MEAISNNRLLFLFTALASLALTLWAITIGPIINPDAILYLSAATEFSSGSFENGVALYKWPFYSVLISLIHSATGLNVQSSAYTINACMHMLATLGFVACVHALGGNKRILIIAALIILLFPSLNKYRAFIIRDAGFIAFYLWSIYYLLLGLKIGLKKPNLKYLTLSFLSISLATLFRIEAVATLVIIPCYLLYIYNNNKNWRLFWLCVTVVLGATLLFGISVWLFGEHSLKHHSGLWNFLSASMQYAIDNLSFKIHTIQKHILNEFSRQFAPTVLITSVIIIVCYETLRRLSFITAYFSWHAIKKELVLTEDNVRKTFYILCLIQLTLLFLFALINLFLVSRHTLALCLTILLLAPFSINYFYEKWRSLKSNNAKNLSLWGLPALAALLLLMGVEGLDVKSNKPKTKELGLWLATQIDPEYSVYSNNSLVLHYADRKPAYFNLRYNWKETDNLLATKQIFDFDYAAITLNRNHENSKSYINKRLKKEPITEKLNSDNQLLLIYDLREITPNQPLDNKYIKVKH